MAAIITDDFRRNAANLLVDDITTGGSNYFVGIGKSDAYDDDASGLDEDNASFTLPNPVASRAEELEVLNNLATLSKVGNQSAYRVMPRVYFRTGKRYKVYDPNDPNCFFAETIDGVEYEPCYVINTDLEVYLCLKNNDQSGVNTVTVAADEPTMTDTLNDIYGSSETGKVVGLITTTSDLYRWGYVCTLNRDSGFFTQQFAAVGNPGDGAVKNTALGTRELDEHPSEATGGLIYGFKVVNGGAGYTAGDLDVDVTGLAVIPDSDLGNVDKNDLAQYNQTITCTVKVDGSGTITSCVTKLNSGEIDRSSTMGVVNANAVSNDTAKSQTGSGAILEPMILPLEGLGTDNLKLLPSYYCGIRADFEDDLGGDGLFIPFRQVSLIKDPDLVGGDDPNEVSRYAAGEAAKALRWVAYDSATTTATIADLAPGDILFDSAATDVADAVTNELPIAIFDYLDETNNRIYYHQNFDDEDSQNLLELADGGGTLKWYDKSAGSLGSNVVGYSGDPQYAEYTIADFSASTYEKYGRLNGEVLFIENRSKIERADDQIEEVRMIIQF